MKKLVTIIGVLLVVAIFIAGCANTANNTTSNQANSTSSTEEKTKSVVDSAGKTVKLPATIKRIADLDGAHDEIVTILGYGGKIVTSGEETGPDITPWLYKVNPDMNKANSNFKSGIDIETLMSTKPDVAFFEKGDTNIDKVVTAGIPVVQWSITNFDTLKKAVSVTASALGPDALKKADKYNNYLDTKIDSIKKETSQLDSSKKPKVLHLVSLSPIKIDGGNNMINDWIELAGGTNAAQGIDGKNKEVSMEQILKWNPDIIILGKIRVSGKATSATDMKNTIMNSAQWKQVAAVSNNKVFASPDGAFSWDRLGPEEALQIQWAAKTIHPELFSNINMEKETKSFYKTFLNYNLTDDETNKILNALAP